MRQESTTSWITKIGLAALVAAAGMWVMGVNADAKAALTKTQQQDVVNIQIQFRMERMEKKIDFLLEDRGINPKSLE